jgi:uncharacterized protein
MTATQTLPTHESRDAYAPAFSIEIAGGRLADSVLRDVIQVTYRDSVNEFDSCQFELQNWDPEKRLPKYEPASASEEGPLDPGAELTLSMGYGSDLRQMLSGTIQTVEPDFPASGSPTVTVNALSRLHSLRKKPHTWFWEDKTDGQIAQEIGRQAPSEDRPGIGVQVELHEAVANEPPNKFVFMENEHDIVFLLRRARRRGYSFYLDDQKGKKPVLRYGPFQEGPALAKPLELAWGRSMLDFRPRLATADQVEKVTVRGWNRRTRETIVGKAEWGDSGLDMNRDLGPVRDALDGRHRVISNRPVHTKAEADFLAQGILRDQLEKMLTATGSTFGIPELVAGRKLALRGFGPRFSGIWFVTDSTHTIGASGYQTSFGARREGPLQGGSS